MFGLLGTPPLDEIPQITLRDEFGEVHFFPIPYTEPETLRYLTRLQGQEIPIRTHQEVMKWVTDKIQAQCPTGRRIVMAHAFIAGGDVSDSERDLLVGGAANVEARLFAPFTYTALGHLHRPQSFGENVRYAGSPLKYSFSEAHHSKSITMLTLDAHGVIDEAVLPLLPMRDMHRVAGVIENHEFKITSKNGANVHPEDFLEVTLENDQQFLNPMSIVQKVFRNAMHLRRAENLRKRSTQGIDASSLKTMKPLELFTAFYKKCSADQELTDQQIRFLAESIRALQAEDKD
jgi:exonuclease SbcD